MNPEPDLTPALELRAAVGVTHHMHGGVRVAEARQVIQHGAPCNPAEQLAVGRHHLSVVPRLDLLRNLGEVELCRGYVLQRSGTCRYLGGLLLGLLGLRGGAIGLALAAATLIGGAALAGEMAAPLLPRLVFPWSGWAGLAALPFATAAIATVTARVTVMRALARLA